MDVVSVNILFVCKAVIRQREGRKFGKFQIGRRTQDENMCLCKDFEEWETFANGKKMGLLKTLKVSYQPLDDG